MKRNVFSTFLIHKGTRGTQCSSGSVPFLQIPLGFGQAQEQISPESSVINTVMAEECSMKQSLKGNAAFLLKSEKEIQGSFFTNHKREGKNNLWENAVAHKWQYLPLITHECPHADLQLYFYDAQRNLMFILRVAPQVLCPEGFFPEQLHGQLTVSLKEGATAGKRDTFFIP